MVTVHGRACHPQTQGKEERFHRTLKAELLSRMDLRDLRHAQEAFDTWRGTYNLQRPHEALGMAVPASRYACSLRPYPEELPEVEYAPGEVLRRVKHDGTVSCLGRAFCIGEAFAGEWVALRQNDDGRTHICHGPHPVATIALDPASRPLRRRPPLASLAPDAGGHANADV